MNTKNKIDEFIKTIIVEDDDSCVQLSVVHELLSSYCEEHNIECPFISSYLFRLFPNTQYIKIDVDGARMFAFSRLKLIS